jgi:hypothetical protein
MKNFLGYVLSVLLMGGIFLSCSDQQAPTANDEVVDPLNKVTVVEYFILFDLSLEPPYTNCVTGAPMQNHGIATLHITEKTTPSGNWIATGYLDYNSHGGITLENTSTNEIWTLQNGTNPFNEIAKHNGAYRIHYHYNELYKLNNQNLHIKLKGFFAIDKDGNVTREIHEITCN